MKRAKKQGRQSSGLVGVDNRLVVGGVIPGSTRRPRETSRSSTGRIGSALSVGGGKSAPRASRKAPGSSKAMERADNAGGKVKKPAAATKSTVKGRVKKAKPEFEQSAFLAPVPPDRRRRRRAEGRVKGLKIKQAGLESRLLGHVSGSGKRNQARRDSKNG